MLAMTGKDCVGICSDSRLGSQAQTVATDFEKIFKMGDKLMVRAKPYLYCLEFDICCVNMLVLLYCVYWYLVRHTRV